MNVERAFTRQFGSAIQPANLNFATVSALLADFPETFSIVSAPSSQSYLQLNPSIRVAGFSLPLPANQTYSLWERQPLFGNLPPIAPPNPSCLPQPNTLLLNKCKFLFVLLGKENRPRLKSWDLFKSWSWGPKTELRVIKTRFQLNIF